MSYSQVNLILSLPRLIKTINRSIKPDYISKITSGMSTRGNFLLFIRLNGAIRCYCVEITPLGFVNDYGLIRADLLKIVNDWVLHIDMKRQNERIVRFKKELLELVWRPSRKFLLID